ncbi:MAG: 4-hydroxy-tetrahydrodipicolinate synthase [Desulfobacterales bacterium]|nr:4-hydroxy-tetrahydrodipicolinate synthase [Desulfobacterales bacterium]
MEQGCYTALVTPFNAAGELDQDGLAQLIEFQTDNGITGILATGTTGESPTFKWKEHDLVIALTAKQVKGKCKCIAGTGSNNTAEAIVATGHAAEEGVDSVLLVDPYYNGPSSLEIRREYYEPIAREYPDLDMIPYIIPGRTGAQMLAQDLAILAKTCPNISSVKEATGNPDNMRLTRKLCGDDFNILSGDDGLVYDIMTDADIKACGSISVMSNIAPGFMSKMVALLNQGQAEEAKKIQDALKPLLDLVVVTTDEESEFGSVSCRARNPLPLKTMMQILGMPGGPCRPPLGKMTRKGFDVVLAALNKVQTETPEIFAPIAKAFNVDIDRQLNDAATREEFWYNY